MAIYRLLRDSAFDDQTVKAMKTAYEGALQDLAIKDRSDPLTEIVATKIIEIAWTGERDSARLRERAVEALDGWSNWRV
jgi:hypothetical protein